MTPNAEIFICEISYFRALYLSKYFSPRITGLLSYQQHRPLCGRPHDSRRRPITTRVRTFGLRRLVSEEPLRNRLNQELGKSRDR